MKKITLFLLLVFSGLAFTGFAQTETESEGEYNPKLFTSYFEMGYIFERSPDLGNGLVTKTGFEYRLQNANSIFFRVNYDSYSTSYTPEATNLSIQFTDNSVDFSDALAGLGYRYGEKNLKVTALVQGGLKFYNHPTVFQNEDVIMIGEVDGSLAMSRTTIGIEYFLDETFAITFDIFQNHVWSAEYFWTDKRGGHGFTVGLVGSFF